MGRHKLAAQKIWYNKKTPAGRLFVRLPPLPTEVEGAVSDSQKY